jgi:hypothetical protein
MQPITIQNEIVNYLSKGARYDVTHYRGTKADRLITVTDTPVASMTQVVIKVYNQKHGTLIKTWTINQTASDQFTWTILATDLATELPLNYWVDAVDQDGELIYYGAFELL